MSPFVVPVPSSETVPTHADIVVIGGGIIGVSTAWYLRKRGLSVAVCEKGVIAGEQSSRNWGYCRQQGRDPAELPLTIEALRLWRSLDAEIQEDTGFKQAGIMYIAQDESELARYEAWQAHAAQYQLDTKILSSKELSDYLPDCGTSYPGALLTPSDGRAEPSMAAPAIARALIREGGTVHTNCAVRGLETEGGRISAVVTEKGRLKTRSVVLAGGAWSSLFLKRHGVALPQLKVRSSVLRTTPGPSIGEAGLSAPGYSIRRQLDGGYSLSYGMDSTFHIVPDAFRWFFKFWNAMLAERGTIKLSLDKRFLDELATPTHWALDAETPFEKTRVLDPEPDVKILDKGLANFKAAFPALRDLGIEERWAGMIDVTPDAVPVIAPIEQVPGLTLATGFSGHGFGIGPGAGRLTADLVTGDTPVVDPAPFRYTRMFDGTRLAPNEA